MQPSIDLFGFHIASYGLMILLGFAAGLVTAVLRAKITGHKREDLMFASLYGAIGTAAGAKLLYLLTILPFLIENFEKLLENPDQVLSILAGGFVFYGGLIGGALGIWIYCRQYHLPFFHLVEALVPSIPLIHAFGRTGCFLAGCCYGIAYPPPIGMFFDLSPYAPQGISLFPVQLLEAALNLLIFVILLIVARKRRSPGIVLGSYLILYPIARFILEFYRWDDYRGFLFGLSTSQWISILLFAAGIVLLRFAVAGSQKSIRK